MLPINEQFDAAAAGRLMDPSRSSVNTIGVHYLKIWSKLATEAPARQPD